MLPRPRRSAAAHPPLPGAGPGHDRAARVLGWLGVAAWVLLSAGGAAVLASLAPEGTVSGAVAGVAVGGMFSLLIVRLLCGIIVWPTRRIGLLLLAGGVLLWAAGSTTLTVGTGSETTFPSPSEIIFLAAYAGIAASLLRDVPARAAAAASTWLEVIVIGGGAGALAGGLLVTPLAPAFGRQGVPLLVALLYPLLDVVLIVLVGGQIVLRQRPRSAATAELLVALLLLMAGDTSLVVNLSEGTYSYGMVPGLLWVAGFVLLVDSACRPPSPWGLAGLGRVSGGVGVVFAAGIAVVVLVFQPAGEARVWVVTPAVVTLVSAGARLLLALREARFAAEAFRLSQTDDLTGLANRRGLMARVRAELATTTPWSVMLVDLDGFKEINDSLGHAAGDLLLRTMATRLEFLVPPNALAARLSADEFGLMLPGMSPDAAAHFGRDVLSALAKPVRIDGLELAVGGSVGVAGVRPDDEPGSVLRRADVALFQAKERRGSVAIYDPERDEFSRHRLRLAAELRDGIASGQLELWYQPQIAAGTWEVCGVEALVRWRHPSDGLLAPGSFLPTARRAGLMAALSEVVVRQVIADARRWQDRGCSFVVAVNIAPPELLSGPVLARLFHDAASAGLPPNSIVVEVTEDSFMAEPDRARAMIDDIRRHDHQVAIDDYGTGFSSLAYLCELPVNEVKIDRSFVAQLLTDHRTHMIVATTNAMAHGLGLRTVAEGVEDAETAEALVRLGFDVLQGFHFAAPMPAQELTAWVTRWTAEHVERSGIMRS